MERLGASRHWLIWAAVVPVAIWAVIRAFGLDRQPPIVPLIAYTPYVAVLALLVLGIAVALENWAAALLATAATAALLAAVAPRAIGDPEAIPPGSTELRVLSSNIHLGHADAGALVRMVRRLRPDVLCVQELTPRFSHELEADGILRLLPHAVLSIEPHHSGGGIFSRLPVRPLPAPRAFVLRMPRARVELPGGRSVRFVDVHSAQPKPSNILLWRLGLASLPTTGPPGAPWVLAGDFNATVDFSQLRDVIDRGYRDAAEVVGMGLEPTWPRGRVFPPVTIDHLLADRRIAVAGYRVEDLPGSDHRAVFARLAVPAS